MERLGWTTRRRRTDWGPKAARRSFSGLGGRFSGWRDQITAGRDSLAERWAPSAEEKKNGKRRPLSNACVAPAASAQFVRIWFVPSLHLIKVNGRHNRPIRTNDGANLK